MAGQIIRRGDRKWLVRIFLGRDASTGKRRYHNHTVRGSKKDAERYRTAALRSRDLGPLCLLYLRAFRGDREGARDLLSEVPEPDGDTESLTCSSCDAMVIAAEALVMLGLNERAASFHTPIAAMVERGVWTTSGVFPLLQRVLGMLAAACQRWDEAEERYRAALTQARESGLRKELAETTYWCARLALERSDGRNPARAAALLGGAIEEYRQIGMPRHLERAEALLSKARSVEPRMNGSRN